MRRLIHVCVLVLGATTASVAEAACQVSTSELAFGVVDIARGSDSTGEVRLTCVVATTFEIALVGSGSPGSRYMSGPNGDRLTYDLYPDATRSVPWGDGSGAGVVVPGSNDGNEPSRFPVYGRVPTQAGVAAGVYSDSLTVVVSF